MKALFRILLGGLVLTAAACTPKDTFWLGADISGSAGQEARGENYYDADGNGPIEITALMKQMGLNAVRLRVWVQPRRWGRPGQPVDSTDNRGLCNKEDVLYNCLLAKQLGMAIMIDFHYSDTWADPGHQPIPRSWLGHPYEQMKEDLKAHTVETLQLLKDNGIDVKWVQVGNETTNGMLWSVKTDERGWEVKDSLGHTTITHSMGHFKTQPQQYAGFIRTGYDAVKEVFPDATVIVHLDRGHQQALYDNHLDTLLKYGGRWDMIGMSLYPYWAQQDHPELRADDIITDCMANIRHVSEKYGCDVMIVETGFEVDEQHPEVMDEGRRLLSRVIREARYGTYGHCRGVFYWEPQCLPGSYKLGAFDSNAAPTAIMDGFLDVFFR